MCLNPFLARLMTTALAVVLLAAAARAEAAEELRLARDSAFSPVLTAFTNGTLTIGYLTPAYGAVSLGVSPAAPLSARTTLSGLDVGGSYTTPLIVLGPAGGRIGVFGAYDERPSIWALTPATSWNLGASVGYAGFYLRGGVNESAAVGPLLGIQGLQAGFGYEIGALDLRLSYLASQGAGVGEQEIDSRQWAIGGMYQITPRIRLNADAFYGISDGRGTPLAILPPLTAPPGTGARVGVELRF